MSPDWQLYLSIIGAAAWLPAIISWLSKHLSKPKLTIISGETLEIGYTALGPIINVWLAFTSENKDALIDRITIELVHEKKDTHQFKWEWFEEELMSIEAAETPLIPYKKKNQKAIGIKVSLGNLIEKKIGFNEIDFKREERKRMNELKQAQHIWISQGRKLDDLTKEASYLAYNDLIKDSFIWKTGKYTAEITVYTNREVLSFSHTIRFILTQLDTKNLEKNIATTREFTELLLIKADDVPQLSWQWIYPEKIDG